MSLDPSKISIIRAQKVDPKKLSTVGDTATVAETPKEVQKAQAAERPCHLCCVAYGSLIDSVMVVFLTSALTGIAIFAEKRVNYSFNGAMRQVAWLAFPGTLVGATVHYFLSEAMWSNKRNSWGQAWMKAMVINTVVWCSGIGLGTLFWRKLMPLTAAGRRFYHRYPVPTEPLESRLLRSNKEFFTGMGWSYWLGGVASGHMGLLTVVAFCVYNDRPYMMMTPEGGYSKRCMPPWRRQQLAFMANTPLTEAIVSPSGKSYVTRDGITTGKGIKIGYKGASNSSSGKDGANKVA